MTNGYILLVSEEVPTMPLYAESDAEPNYRYLLQFQERTNRSCKIDIKYGASTIKKWNRKNEKLDGKKPYYIGVSTNGAGLVKYSIGIDPIFLVSSMELTKSRTIHIADKYCGSLMISGNGITIYIMPILTPSESANETIIKEV